MGAGPSPGSKGSGHGIFPGAKLDQKIAAFTSGTAGLTATGAQNLGKAVLPAVEKMVLRSLKRILTGR